MKKKSFADILSDISGSDLARMRRKVPEWADTGGLVFPTGLSMEQCSSSATARYKASLAREITGGGIIDLTGGLGVDCWAFSLSAPAVHHNEMDAELSDAVRHNFAALGVTNASFSCIEVTPDTLTDVLDAAGFEPGLIYLDPARRSGTGRKVFLLEDCRPDLPALKEALLDAAQDILVKLSPMADITMVCRRLGPEVREVHVVGAEGECKEILVWMHGGWHEGYTIVVGDLRFTPEEETAARPAFLPGPDAVKGWLFEPSPTLMKAGCFNLLSSRHGLFKLGRFTHLYVTGAPSEELDRYGKLFEIIDTQNFDGRSIKALGKSLKRCEVTARNLPISSEELRRKMGVTSGGDTHVFAFTADFADTSQRLLAVTRRSL